MTPPFLHPYLARLLTALWLGVVPLLWIACVPETALESQFSCPSNGSVDTANRRVCRDGLWERLGDMDTVDMDPGTDACISPSEAELCADQAEQKCETQQVRDACGKNRFIRCKRCEVGQECSGGTMCEAVIGCETAAQVCKRLDVSCGVVSEVLTNCTTLPSVNCGGCQGIGENCNESSGRCECVAEAAQATCQRKSNACGMNTLENNCGQMVQVDCGGCAQGDCLSDGTCSQCQEETVTGFCARLGRACGPASGPDACTKRQRSEECGSCANDRVCSNSGQCDCPVPSCQGLECGPISNRCGQTADCPSSCGANEFCASNQCQCTPETKQQLCAAAGRTCGDFKVTDRCGKSREPDCGGCPGGQVCRANQGVCCTPRAEAQLCSDNNLQCGTKMVTDNCGVSRMVNCGMNCPGPYNSCNLATNQCQCNDTRNDAQLCMAKSFKCGMASVQDGCNKSRTVNCGNAAQSCTMPPNTTCSGNQCVCVDARTDTQLCVDQNACGMTMLTDNCGFRQVNCGQRCSSPTNTCSTTNRCVCEDNRTDTQLCADNNACGVTALMTTCGTSRMVNCGDATQACTSPNNTCMGNQCVCVDSRDDLTICAAQGIQCGKKNITDMCGVMKEVDCMQRDCPSNQPNCTNDNKCKN